MPRKTFVYPHPINAYIIKQLGLTVEEFCELHAFSICQQNYGSGILRPFKTARRLFATLRTSQTNKKNY